MYVFFITYLSLCITYIYVNIYDAKTWNRARIASANLRLWLVYINYNYMKNVDSYRVVNCYFSYYFVNKSGLQILMPRKMKMTTQTPNAVPSTALVVVRADLASAAREREG